MIKAVFHVKDRRIVLMGLTADNVSRLRDGKPIAFNGNILGLGDVTLSICYGETSEAITADLTKNGLMDHIVATPDDPDPVLQPAGWDGAGTCTQTFRHGGPGTP